MPANIVCAEARIPSHEQSSLPLVYPFIQMSYAGMRSYRSITFLDGCPPLLLTEMNFLVHLQEVGVTSQNLTLKQHQTPTLVLLVGMTYNIFL